MNFFLLSIVSQILLFIYFEVTTLINLYPFNDPSKYSNREKTIEASVNGVVILIGIILFVSQVKWLMIISVIFWFIFLIMQVINWWMPYLTGHHLKKFPRELYDTHFQKTIKILPAIKNHIIPDLQHNILQVLSLLVFVLSFLTIIF